VVPPERAAPVFYRCSHRIGHELAGWLAGGVALQ
jgi:hypothetical protein